MKKEKMFSKKLYGGEKMNNWKLAFLPVMLLFVVGIAQAAITSTLTAPAAGGYVSGTYTLTCTGAGITNATTLDNATFSYGSTTIGTNATEVNATTWTYIWDSTAVDDHIADFTCVVTDSDGVTHSDASLAAIIDNTVPACTWVLPTGSNDEIEPGDTLSVTLTGTGGEDATCTALTFGSNPAYTPTLATGGGSCSWQDDGKPPEGIYDMSIVVSDGTNSTTCSLTDIVVQEEENIAGINKQASDLMDKEKEEIQKESTDKRFKNLAIILGLCLLAYIVFFEKKK